MSLSVSNSRRIALCLAACALSCAIAASDLAASPLSRSNGYFDLACADSLDYRGDVNLNGLPYEVADYQTFSDYFLNGLAAFTIDPNIQIPTTDINADGVPLQIGDLVYLGLVIEGLANPFPKVASPESDLVRFHPSGDTLMFEATRTLGAVYLVFDREVHPVLCQADAQIAYNFDGSITRVLILGSPGYRPAKLTPGALLSFPSVPFPTSAETCDTMGQNLPTRVDSPTDVGNGNGSRLPAGFALEQNYPNPFNPSTAISFSLPRNTTYSLTVYSVTGQEVARFSGSAGPGRVTEHWDASACASGVYLYRLIAGPFTDARKMLLVK